MSLVLLGDRVLREGEGRAFDLATAEEVRLVERVIAAGEPRAAWRDECQAAVDVWRSDRASLIDYVEVGQTRCVEVWTMGETFAVGRRHSEPAVDAGSAIDTCPPAAACPLGGGDLASGSRCMRASDATSASVPAVAIRVLPRAASDGVCAAFDDDRFGAMKRFFVRAPAGAGLTTWLRLIARDVRRRGFVPMCPAAIARWPAVVPLIRDRSVVLLCDRRDDARAGQTGTDPAGAVAVASTAIDDGVARALLTLACARMRVGAVVCRAPATTISGPMFHLGRLPIRALAHAVMSDAGGAALEPIARKADGLPGRFVALLRGDPSVAPDSLRARAWTARRTFAQRDRMTGATGLLRVAEAAAPYAPPSQCASAPSQSDMVIADAWNLHGRQALVIRDAEALIARGRWAGAIRTLRANIAFNQRRGAPHPGAVAALALARLHLTRCEIAEADRWCREAGELASRTQDELLAAEALHWYGLIALEQADLEASDRWLRMALMAAEQQGHRALQQQVELSLARCLFWQGCIGQMSRACELVEDEALPGPLRAQALRLAARRHLARGELSEAGTLLATAFEITESLDAHERREWRGALCVDRARLQLAIGDPEQCLRNLAAAAASKPTAARLARIRLVQMQCDQRERSDETRRRVVRLTRVFLQARMPRLLRLRARYWTEPESRRSAELAAFIDRYGETALASGLAPAHGSMAASHFRALLQMSHEIGDERALLARICGYARKELDAAYVAVHGAPGGRPLLGSSGQSRLASPALAARVIDTGQFVSPTAAAEAIDAGTPVWAQGQIIGALVCRWIIDSSIDRPLAAILLPAAADAAAPHVQAILDRAALVSMPARSETIRLAAPHSAARVTSQSAIQRSGVAVAPSLVALGAPSASDSRDSPTPSPSLAASILGVSALIVTLREAIARAADAPFHVLIEGESGSGKELVARALHQHSVRRVRRFCAVNCAALSDELLEAELFGHARGAFTGALAERIGLFEEAHEGTLFLDEVGELSPRAQAKLLRAIQDGEIRRIGENLPRRVQPRIVAATNRTLRDEAAAGRFRPDLLYRLDVVRIIVPPLRERIEDVPVLAHAFWQQALTRTGSRATLDPETLAALARYDWPGNVRELQNVIARLAVQAPARGRVAPIALPPPIRPAVSMSDAMPLHLARRAFEEQFVRAAIARAGGHLSRAARDLGLSRQGLNKLLARLDIATADDMSHIDG